MSSAHRIRVMVVDDHPIMRDGLRDALEASGRFEVVGLAEGWRGGGEDRRGAATGGDRHGCDDAGQGRHRGPAGRSWSFCRTPGC